MSIRLKRWRGRGRIIRRGRRCELNPRVVYDGAKGTHIRLGRTLISRDARTGSIVIYSEAGAQIVAGPNAGLIISSEDLWQ